MRNRVREMRLKKGWGHAKLAESIGISRQALWVIEAQKAEPRLRTVERLLAVFGVEFGEMFYDAPGEGKTDE
ncbi:MAG: helix-turn-helix transcriptional regulator [Acidobacteriaceae bacterium]